MKLKYAFVALAIAILPGCAGMGRSWSAGCAENFGADWVVVQYRQDGTAFHCWKLSDVSMTNEKASDGIYWKDRSWNLVHISGWYNRVQVFGGRYEAASVLLGVESSKCDNGVYPSGK